MKALFDRWLPALTLALWGGTILYAALDGRLSTVVAGEFQTYAIIASVLLLLCALALVLYPADASCCADSACGHGLSRSRTGKFLTFSIILLPIALTPFGSKAALDEVLAKNRVATVDARNLSSKLKDTLEKRFARRPDSLPPQPAPPVAIPDNAQSTALSNPPPPPNPPDMPVLPGTVQPPPPLPLPGAQPGVPAADQPGSVAQAPTDWLLRTPDGLIIAEVIDLLYAAQDNTLRADFEGKKIELKAQYLPDKTGPGNRFKAVRMFMTCCAADARPVATFVEFDQSIPFKDMDWVRIVGVPTFPIEKGRRVAVIKAEKMEKTEPIQDDMANQPQDGQPQAGQ